MDALFEFLNKNSGALSVLFSAAVTVATVVYAILTWKLVRETMLLREAQTEPRIEITAQPFETAFKLPGSRCETLGWVQLRDYDFESRWLMVASQP
jgi:hypothetical protein